MSKENVAILGASDHPDRYSHMALIQLLENGHNPLLINPRLDFIDGIKCYPHLKNIEDKVLNFEPHNAIFVDNKNPLIFYKAILEFSILNLKEGGMIYFEINPVFFKALIVLINSYNRFYIIVKKDISKNYRMIRLKKKHE